MKKTKNEYFRHVCVTEGVTTLINEKEFGTLAGAKLLTLRNAPGMTRTCDLLVRSQTLYPTELRAPLKSAHSAIRL